MIASVLIHGTVVSLALSSVSLMGAGLAPAIMVKVMGWRHTAGSIAAGMLAGLASAIAWKYAGLGSFINEAGIGIACGLAVNWLVAWQAGEESVVTLDRARAPAGE